ncbi:MAG TPA: septation protein IspZ, partial [Rhizomicrobium sp.]
RLLRSDGVRSFLPTARMLLMDLASTILFFGIYAITDNILLAVVLAVAVAIAQIGWQLLQKKPVDTLQWISLVVVIASGTATLITNNPVFVMLKPSLIYLAVGAAMLKRGWMNRYLPDRALQFVPDLAIIFGYVWAGLMFFSAALNLVLALTMSVTLWGTVMTIWGIASKTILSIGSFAIMKAIGRRRVYAQAANA